MIPQDRNILNAINDYSYTFFVVVEKYSEDRYSRIYVTNNRQPIAQSFMNNFFSAIHDVYPFKHIDDATRFATQYAFERNIKPDFRSRDFLGLKRKHVFDDSITPDDLYNQALLLSCQIWEKCLNEKA